MDNIREERNSTGIAEQLIDVNDRTDQANSAEIAGNEGNHTNATETQEGEKEDVFCVTSNTFNF